MITITEVSVALRYLRTSAVSLPAADLQLLDEAAHLIDDLVDENSELREENADLNAQLDLWLEEASANA